VLHVAGFITVYEAFLGMEQHVDLFRRIFTGRALSEGMPPRTAPVGGFALQKKPSSSDAYPVYTPCDSNQGWHGEWFYISNPTEASFLPFIGRRSERRESWSWGPSSWQNKVEIIGEELQKLVQHDLDGLRVFHTFFHRRVAPLAERMRRCGHTPA